MPSVTYSSSKPSAPESITILTSGNYTVPAGKSAKISAICNGSATVSLDGQVVLTGATWDAMRINNSPQTITASRLITGTLNVTYSGKAINANSPFIGSAPNPFAPGQTILSDVSTSNYRDGTVSVSDTYTNSTAQSALSASYTVPAGTVVGTSGGRCVIEIYSA